MAQGGDKVTTSVQEVFGPHRSGLVRKISKKINLENLDFYSFVTS
jgi:hypothetical protein